VSITEPGVGHFHSMALRDASYESAACNWKGAGWLLNVPSSGAGVLAERGLVSSGRGRLHHLVRAGPEQLGTPLRQNFAVTAAGSEAQRVLCLRPARRCGPGTNKQSHAGSLWTMSSLSAR